MARNSSTRRAAKLAQQSGGGPRLRFQGGRLFPLAVALSIIIGIGLIVYGRATLPSADATPPTTADRWQVAYGFYLCDTWYQLDGSVEDRNITNGVYSNGDGIIQWAPTNSSAVGSNAKLGVFLDNYDVEITDETIEFGDVGGLGGQERWEEGDTECDGDDGEVSVVVWDNVNDTDSGTRYISNVKNIPITDDDMVIGIFYSARDIDQEKPPWSGDLAIAG